MVSKGFIHSIVELRRTSHFETVDIVVARGLLVTTTYVWTNQLMVTHHWCQSKLNSSVSFITTTIIRRNKPNSVAKGTRCKEGNLLKGIPFRKEE
ncbi:hypothetical protein COLO4_05668 [Corchorus olitorius]|uniref:Uncharacterized protein n=1 Tax=Corchorus olitorius TaxID=93759 RepID=A0A1R3KQ89_9ROSI|nr:hypothetical protein COLO4_05668 [Corchorus olitorius]